MPKTQDIILDKLQKGLADSPYVGYGKFQNLDIFSQPGIAKMKYRLTLSFAPVGLPTAIEKDVFGNIYVGTDQGYVYKNGVDLTSGKTRTQIYDMKVWKNYLFITRLSGSAGGQNSVDVYGPLSSFGPLYTQVWKSLTAGSTGYNAPIVPAGTGSLYFGAGNAIDLLTAFTTGDTVTAPTGTLTSAVISLPYGEYCRTARLLNRYLLIGIQGGSNFTSGITEQLLAKVYPYDLQINDLLLPYPIEFQENGINQILVNGNIAYIHAGIYGNIYKTNGVTAEFLKRLPFNREFGNTFYPYPNALAMVNNELTIGVGGNSSTYANFGIYSIKEKVTNFRTISTLNTGTSQNLFIGAILPTGGDFITVGWQDGSTYGVDVVDSKTYGSYSCLFEGPVEIVAEPQNNATYDDIIVYLSSPLVAGQQIRLQWKDGLTDTWNTISDLSGKAYFDVSSADAGATAIYGKSLINNANTVQVQCAMQQDASIAFGNNIGVLGIKILKHT